MAKKKKPGTAIAKRESSDVIDANFEHPFAAHPAVGLLDCARGVKGKRYRDQGTGQDADDETPGKSAMICGDCGFDAAFHALEASDYSGEKPRPSPWLEKLEELEPDVAKAEASG